MSRTYNTNISQSVHDSRQTRQRQPFKIRLFPAATACAEIPEACVSFGKLGSIAVTNYLPIAVWPCARRSQSLRFIWHTVQLPYTLMRRASGLVAHFHSVLHIAAEIGPGKGVKPGEHGEFNHKLTKDSAKRPKNCKLVNWLTRICHPMQPFIFWYICTAHSNGGKWCYWNTKFAHIQRILWHHYPYFPGYFSWAPLSRSWIERNFFRFRSKRKFFAPPRAN